MGVAKCKGSFYRGLGRALRVSENERPPGIWRLVMASEIIKVSLFCV